MSRCAPELAASGFPFDSRFSRWQGVRSNLTGIESIRFLGSRKWRGKIMAEFAGSLLVAQSGGPTAVINASLAGIIQEAGRHPDQIEQIYGGLNGLWGISRESFTVL